MSSFILTFGLNKMRSLLSSVTATFNCLDAFESNLLSVFISVNSAWHNENSLWAFRSPSGDHM